MVASYREDVHGGAGERGVQAKCTQCHLRHDNAINYMVSRARFGMHDAWAQLTYNLDAVEARCATCHEIVGHKNLGTYLATAGKEVLSQ